jgi:RNA polymerase sigma-70 factor (ECF subfamily)
VTTKLDPQEQTRDEALVEACLKGTPQAFDELVCRHKDRVYNLLVRYLGNEQDALDAAQEVFLRAYRGLHGFTGRARLSTWLYSIAANLASNRLRDGHRKGRDKGVSLEHLLESAPAAAGRAISAVTNPRDLAQKRELDDLLQQELGCLPDHYRMPFILRVIEGMSYAEISEVLDCPEGTVKSRLSEARRRLREQLVKAGVV